MYKKVYDEKGEMFEVTEHIFEEVVLQKGWTQTAPENIEASEEADEPAEEKANDVEDNESDSDDDEKSKVKAKRNRGRIKRI